MKCREGHLWLSEWAEKNHISQSRATSMLYNGKLPETKCIKGHYFVPEGLEVPTWDAPPPPPPRIFAEAKIAASGRKRRKESLSSLKNSNMQICWSCKNACGGCNWSAFGEPVEGWTAKPDVLNVCGKKTTSYKIRKGDCPEYEMG